MVMSYRRKQNRERNHVRGVGRVSTVLVILEQQAFVISELVLVRKPVFLGPWDQGLLHRRVQWDCGHRQPCPSRVLLQGQSHGPWQSLAAPGQLAGGSVSVACWPRSSPRPLPLGLSITQRPAWQLLSINSSEE